MWKLLTSLCNYLRYYEERIHNTECVFCSVTKFVWRKAHWCMYRKWQYSPCTCITKAPTSGMSSSVSSSRLILRDVSDLMFRGDWSWKLLTQGWSLSLQSIGSTFMNSTDCDDTCRCLSSSPTSTFILAVFSLLSFFSRCPSPSLDLTMNSK